MANRSVNQLNNRVVTVAEAAELLHVHPNTVRRWGERGLLREYRIGPRRDRRFYLADVERLLQSY